MIIHCPACGSASSFDVLMAFSDASKAFAAAIEMQGNLGKPLIKYLALFRAQNRNLSFERALKLLQELMPDIAEKHIKRNRQTYPAPQCAWVWAIETMLERRDSGKLQLPLKNHGYLYEVISSFKPEYAPDPQPVQRAVVQAKSMLEMQDELKQHEKSKHEKPAISLAEMLNKAKSEAVHRSLKGIPTDQLYAYISQNKREGESHEQCYQRLKAQEQQ